MIPGGYLLGSTVGGPMVDRWDIGQKICGLSVGSLTGLHPWRVISYDEIKRWEVLPGHLIKFNFSEDFFDKNHWFDTFYPGVLRILGLFSSSFSWKNTSYLAPNCIQIAPPISQGLTGKILVFELDLHRLIHGGFTHPKQERLVFQASVFRGWGWKKLKKVS